MGQIIWTLGAFLLAIGLVVTFHEFGHYWVARRCGVRVLTFSIGFGRPLWSRVAKDGTRYQVAMVPLGGYVRMLDGRVDEVSAEQEHESFSHQPVLKRIAIVLAGPVFNFIFALVALWLMLMIGVASYRPVVGDVTAGSIAAEAGLQRGDEIVRVDGRRTEEWQAVNLALVERIGDSQTEWVVENNRGEQRQLAFDLNAWTFDPDRESTIASLGLRPFQPQVYTSLAQVMDDSPAAQAGLRTGDKILGIDGTMPMDWEQISSFIAANPSHQAEMLVERGGEQFSMQVVFGEQQGQGFLGVVPEMEPYPSEYQFTMQYGPLSAVPQSIDRTWQLMTLSVSMIKKLITGDVSVKNLSGPIGIAVGAGDHASYGLVYFLSFLALISVSLGILNLLPIPVLDGGHLVYYIIEWVRGKPVPEHIQEIGFRVGMLLLFALMALALFNDISRLVP
ncbi:zinc metallopeptidase RseP [Aliidiomarina sedimenti]|uniref:Zinc metalloprotease n=1 Tax=Aliidiomarina sedimenti TaxID=1933879 RepID=A0ABY0C336_9GAMM|nr:sigma E protease regulator RseP [Aliidiomarina sedimenti]RUO32033.1 zinc metallopeptidase RseP [Aliidiomarina sedimenti]